MTERVKTRKKEEKTVERNEGMRKEKNLGRKWRKRSKEDY